MLGTGTTVKLAALLVVPLGVVTLIGPVEAPAGTVAVMWMAESTVNVVALTPLKRTAVAPVEIGAVDDDNGPDAAGAAA